MQSPVLHYQSVYINCMQVNKLVYAIMPQVMENVMTLILLRDGSHYEDPLPFLQTMTDCKTMAALL